MGGFVFVTGVSGNRLHRPSIRLVSGAIDGTVATLNRDTLKRLGNFGVGELTWMGELK